MTTAASSGGCPSGWNASQTIDNKCYLVNLTGYPLAVIQAQKWCRDQHASASLVTIQNGFENMEVQSLARTTDGVWFRNIWIGLNHVNGDWEWISSKTSSYRHWGSFEPHSETDVDCVYMFVGDATWFVYQCDQTLMYIPFCELYI